MRPISSYDFRSIANNSCVMLAWRMRRLLDWPRVALFFPVHLVLMLFFCLFVLLDDLAWGALLPSRFRSLRERYSPVDPD